MKTLTREQLVDKIKSSAGKFFKVGFIKKDGSYRELNGRIGVVKHLKGGETLYDRDRFLCVYDVVNKGYRTVNKSTVQELVIDNEKFEVV
jgi:hypothetical protein